MTFGRQNKKPSLLNLSATNQDHIIRVSGSYIFSGEFFVEFDFSYSALSDSFAVIAGSINSTSSFRILVNKTATLITVNVNSNLTLSKVTDFNIRYKIKVRRDNLNNIFVSYDGGLETNIGVRAGNTDIKAIGIERIDNLGRFLTGKIYSYNINGEIYNLSEGSGNKVYGSLGTEMEIKTINAGGINYINNTIWEIIT